MKNFTRRYVSLLTKLSVLTLFHFTFSDGSPRPYTPHDDIALDCGSTANRTDLSGRSWIADNTIYLDHSDKNQALQTLYRVNVGGSSISPGDDTGSNPQGIHISPPTKSLPPTPTRPKYNIRTTFVIAVGIVSAFVAVSALYILIFRPKSRVEGSSSWYELSNKDYSSVDRRGKVFASDGKQSKDTRSPDTKDCDIL
ncbi:hypothetical protein V6N13_044971 [Hibiscus sabdariffa]